MSTSGPIEAYQDEGVTVHLHEFAPFPVTKDDKPGHVCKGGCACATCGLRKGDRDVHYQTRDRRRPHHDDDGAARKRALDTGVAETTITEGAR